ncbi:MAG: hypothetical protein AAF658_14400, partial [Myxococcota bacterium]
QIRRGMTRYGGVVVLRSLGDDYPYRGRHRSSDPGYRYHRLETSAALAHFAMTENARAEMMLGNDWTLSLTNTYRSWEHQGQLYRRYGSRRASRPGNSLHQSGWEWDLNVSGSARSWLRQNAERFGMRYDPTRLGHETWRWVYDPPGGLPARTVTDEVARYWNPNS